jgi:hypothetical protein
MKERNLPEEDLKKNLKELLERILSESSSSEEFIYIDEVSFHLERIENLYSQTREIFSKLSTSVASFPKIAQDMQVFLKELDLRYKEIEKLIENIRRKETIEDLFVSEEAKSSFISDLEKLYEITNEVREKCVKGEKIIKEKSTSMSFKGREEENLKKLIPEIRHLRNDFQEMMDISDDLISSIRNKRVWEGPPEALDLLYSINLGNKIWSHDIVVKVSGLRSVAGDPYIEEVKLNAPFQPDEEGNLTIDQLFLRYPPFEPIHVEVDGIIGRFVWFMESENAEGVSISDMVNIKEESGKLISVTPMDLLSSSSGCHEVVVKIHVGGDRRGIIFVKYGSENLCKKISNYGSLSKEVIEQIQEDYEKRYIKAVKSGRAYSATNLGYVWFCILGRGLSTDPYDWRCPFVKDCIIGKTMQKGVCDKWSWSRRLFPKVFVVPEREITLSSVISSLSNENTFLFIKPLAIKNVRVHELYRRAQWYMPSIVSEGPVVEVRFKKTIRKSLPRTNVIGFVIPLSLLKAIIGSLLNENTPHKPEVAIIYPNKKVSLDKLMLSKFYIYEATKKGLNSFSFLQKRSERIIENFENFYKKMRKDGELQGKLVNFLVEVIGHTLAHLFLVFISNSLEIEPEDLLYIYKVDEKEDMLLIAVAENSVWGSLDIVEHAKSKFGSLHDMLRKFVNDSIDLLEKHEKELAMFLGKQGSQTNNELLNIIADKVREIYENLADNGVILDTTTFLNHIVLSEEDRKIAEELKGRVQDVKELREWLTDAIIASQINTCIDGCTACVMLERGCTAQLLQNVLLSRNLTSWVLKVLSGKESIKGRGDELGLAIFNQAKERFFAFSPYIDDKGARFLTELAQRGVKVVLVTYENNASRYRDLLSRYGVDIYVLKASKISRHDKFYIIDRRVQIITSQNLSNLSSINDFMFKSLRFEDAERIEKQELEGGAVERYRGNS